jgi:predicted nicotinamide N-methyase
MKAPDGDGEHLAFVRGHTRRLAVPLCPEIQLYTADALTELWRSELATLERLGVDTPYWAVPWAGGQALARYLLDNPESARGLRVLDLGCGSGLCALAAWRSGAARVLANDPDPLALAACAANAAHDEAVLELVHGDLLDGHASLPVDLILAADLWFEATLARRVTGWLRARAHEGVRVLVGDPRRAYLPRTGLELLAEYTVRTPTEIERHALTAAAVWELTGRD